MTGTELMEQNGTAGGRYWPLWGVAAGLLGYVGHLVTMADVSDEQIATGVSVMDAVERGNYHAGVVAGLVAVFCLLVFGAGWQRWQAVHAPSSLAARVATLGLVASAGAMILAYGIKGMLAIYLPGGIDEGTYPAEGLYTLFMIDDMAPFMAWHGVAMAAVAVSWLSLGERRLPLWIGVPSAILALLPLGMLLVTGLPGFPGIVQPLWLILAGVGLTVVMRRSPAAVARPEFAVVPG